MRWACSLAFTIYVGCLGYPWLWFKGDAFEREMQRLQKIQQMIGGIH